MKHSRGRSSGVRSSLVELSFFSPERGHTHEDNRQFFQRQFVEDSLDLENYSIQLLDHQSITVELVTQLACCQLANNL